MGTQRSLMVISTAVLAQIGIGVEASAQVIPLLNNSSPAIQITVSPGSHPTQLSDTGGRAFAASYDSTGRLSTLNATAGRNIADMRVGYDINGRIQLVRFANGYQLSFSYRSDGTEQITDPLGGRIVRASNGSTLVTQATSDPSGVLVETLKRIETLFSGIQPVAGLNPASATAAAQ